MAEDSLRTSSLRAFLAIPLYDVFYQELDYLLPFLRHKVPGVKWLEPAQIHLTLHFFGAILTKELELIHLSFRKIAAFFPPLNLSLAGIGGFPSLESPDVIWLGVREETGQLLSLQKAIQGEIRTLGFKTETRLFQPHVTLGRVRRKSGVGMFLAQVPIKITNSPKMVDHFVLYQSHCLPEGARYEALKAYRLSKKA